MPEEEQNNRSLEQLILWIYSIFTVIMTAAAVILHWALWLVPLLLLGMISCWGCVISQFQSFRFRARFVSAMCLLNYLIYGLMAENFPAMLISMAAVFILLALYGMPEIMGATAGLFLVLLPYHLLIRRTIALPDNARDGCLLLLQGVALLTVEGLVYYFVIKQKKVQQQLSETIEDLKKAEKSKDDFLANVSHEIRTPISTICGISDILRMEPLPEKMHEDVSHIHIAGQHLLAAVSDILDFTELQMGTLTITEEPYEIASTLNDVMNMSMDKNVRGLTIQLSCTGDIPSVMLGDEPKIKRVMLNLLDNAIKFTETGSIRIKVQARKESYGVNLCISVQDTGIGMAPQQVETLFRIFNQADTNSNRNAEGIGLGLVISQKMIHQMRGFMTVKSEPGLGSEFQFVIPQQVLDATPVASMDFDKNRHFSNNFIAPECRILAVDDNEMNLKVITGLLAPYRIQVYIARSGEEALQKMDELIFDFIFMDQMMPKMDGIETLHLIRNKPGEYHQRIPVIALTANAVGGAREMFLAEGFQDYLTKPIDLSDLNRILRKYVPHYKKTGLPEGASRENVPTENLLSGDVPLKKEQSTASEVKKLSPVVENLPPELDAATGLAYCGGSRQDYLDVLDVYLNQGTVTLSKLQDFFEKKDWENYTILVHSLKSNSRGIGAMTLSRQAEELERRGKAKEEAVISALHAPMMKAYRALLDKLRKEQTLRKGNTKEPPKTTESLTELTDTELSSLAETLREKLESFESDGVEEALTKLSSYAYRGIPLTLQLEAVIQKAKNFDYLGAEEALANWREVQKA